MAAGAGYHQEKECCIFDAICYRLCEAEGEREKPDDLLNSLAAPADKRNDKGRTSLKLRDPGNRKQPTVTGMTERMKQRNEKEKYQPIQQGSRCNETWICSLISSVRYDIISRSKSSNSFTIYT